MLITDIFPLLLIPTFSTNVDNGTSTNVGEFDDYWPINNNGSASIPTMVKEVPTILQQVNEELAKLELNDYSEDELARLENDSDEVRELIRQKQEQYDAKTSTTTAMPSTTTSTISQADSLNPTKESGVTSTFTSIKNEISKIPSSVSGFARSLFGKKTTPPPSTTTTTTTTTIAPATQVVPCPQAYQIHFKGGCQNLLQNQFCEVKSSWLVEDPTTMTPKCVTNPCHNVKNTASFGGKCVTVGKSEDCHVGMRTYIYRSGVVECDCQQGYLFHRMDGQCYEAHSKGPCRTGQHFVLDKDNGPICVKNPCIYDGYFCNAAKCPKQRNCKRMGDSCGGNNSTAKFEIDPETFQPFCNEESTELDKVRPGKIIGNVPTLSCAPGSRRDILGNCRKPTIIEFS